MRFPLQLDPETCVVLDGPGATAAATAREVERWRAGQARADGPPMFAPGPLFLRGPAPPEADLRGRGRPVVVDGGPLRALPRCDDEQEVGEAVAGYLTACAPDVVAVWPDADGRHAPAVRAAARRSPELVLLRPGGPAVLGLQLFEAMARRGLYGWGR